MIERESLLAYITQERGHALEELDEDVVLDLLIDYIAQDHRMMLPSSWTVEQVAEKLRSVFVGDPLIETIVSDIMGHLEAESGET